MDALIETNLAAPSTAAKFPYFRTGWGWPQRMVIFSKDLGETGNIYVAF
jgi:hypothetical protein